MGLFAALGTLVMSINDFAVGLDDGTHVRVALHAPFDFKGCDACVEEIVDIVKGAQIFQAEDIGLVFHDRFAVTEQRIRLAAGLGTGTAVAAAAAEEAAHQALAGIGHARCAVDEDFDRNGRLGTNRFDFIRRQFPRKDGLRKAIFFQKADAIQIGNGHLRAAVQGQIGRDLTGQGGNGQVLDDDAVDAKSIEGLQIGRQILQFRVGHQNIDRHIDLDAEEMRRPHGLPYFFITEIMCKFPGIERLSSEINGIGTGINGGEYIF